MKTLIIIYSYHHHNTEKIAQTIAKTLDAQIKTSRETKPEELENYDLIGFGSGIYSAKHHESLLELADKLSEANNKRVFLFSTAAITSEPKMIKDHKELKEKLLVKKYQIIDNFQCKGFNTNSFLKFFGGMNKGRPNAADHQQAHAFALRLIKKEK